MGGLIRGKYQGSYLSYVLSFFFYFFALAAFSTVLSVYLADIGKSPSELSAILSASSFFAIPVVPLAGYIRDRIGNQKAICAALMLIAGACALVFSATRANWLLFLMDGAALSAIGSVMPICERMAGESRYRYGVLRIWGTLGYAAGAQAAGLAIEHLPSGALFVGVCAAAVISVAGFLGTDAPETQKKKAPAPESGSKHIAGLLRNRQYLLYLAVCFVFYGCSAANVSFVPLLLKSLGVSTGAVGTALLLSTLVEIPLILFSHRFMDRFSGKGLFAVACGLALAQYLIYWRAASAPAAVAAMVLLKALASTLYAMLGLKNIANLVPPEQLSTGMAMSSAVGSVSSILLLRIGGALLEAYDIHVLYLTLSALILLTLALLLPMKIGNRKKMFE